MFNYWFLLLFVIGSLGLVLLIKNSAKKGYFHETASELKTSEDNSKIKLDLEKLEDHTRKILEKLLRRCRIIILRLDNNVTKILKNLKNTVNDKKTFSVSSLCDCDFDKDEDAINILEINYIESLQNNPTVEGYLKLAEIYKGKEDLNTCHALLFKAWEINHQDDGLKKFLIKLYPRDAFKK